MNTHYALRNACVIDAFFSKRGNAIFNSFCNTEKLFGDYVPIPFNVIKVEWSLNVTLGPTHSFFLLPFVRCDKKKFSVLIRFRNNSGCLEGFFIIHRNLVGRMLSTVTTVRSYH